MHARDLITRVSPEALRQSKRQTYLDFHRDIGMSVREANDRGFDCLVIGDACGSYFAEFHEVGLRMIAAQGGIFGKVATLEALVTARG